MLYCYFSSTSICIVNCHIAIFDLLNCANWHEFLGQRSVQYNRGPQRLSIGFQTIISYCRLCSPFLSRRNGCLQHVRPCFLAQPLASGIDFKSKRLKLWCRWCLDVVLPTKSIRKRSCGVFCSRSFQLSLSPYLCIKQRRIVCIMVTSETAIDQSVTMPSPHHKSWLDIQIETEHNEKLTAKNIRESKHRQKHLENIYSCGL